MDVKLKKTKYADRSIPRISLHNFEERMGIITEELVRAAETDGFFVLVNHGIELSTISHMFETSKKFFSLPIQTKSLIPFSPTHNIGWEQNSQVRPSTGVADQKESYQLQFNPSMSSYYLPEEILPGFKEEVRGFMNTCQELSEKLMRCFERGLGVEEGMFVKAHDIERRESQTVLRLLHYFEVDRGGDNEDWKKGQAGLEICPGREVSGDFGWGDSWTKVEPMEGEVVCNIGDCLMWWSGERFKSTFHRVVTPRKNDEAGDGEDGDGYGDEAWGDRYSLAFFNNPCEDVVIKGKDEEVTGKEFTERAMERNFSALREKLREKERQLELEKAKGRENGVKGESGAVNRWLSV